MHFILGASFCGSHDVKHILKFAYKNFLDPNIFFILSSIENPKSMQIKKLFEITSNSTRNSAQDQ